MIIKLDKKIILKEADGISVAQVNADPANGKVQVISHLYDGDTVVQVDSYIYEKEQANTYWENMADINAINQMELDRRGITAKLEKVNDVLYVEPVTIVEQLPEIIKE